MAFTQISSTNIQPNTVVAYSEYAAFTANVLPKISSVQYADDTFTVLDDTAANTSGTARLVINGTGFQTGATVVVSTTPASSTARISAEQLRANVSALSAGSYVLYVTNPDGGTAIRVNGVTFSNTPIWSTAATLTNQAANTAFAVNISASSDSNITYSNTTSLPAGTTLLSNGLFYGTVTTSTETTYTFSVKANDVENQDVSRTFSLTVTVGPFYRLYALGGEQIYGDFGLNDIVTRSSPVLIGSDSTWTKLSPGHQTFFGIRQNGTLWTCGRNTNGQLGLNDIVNRSSPVQVGSGTTWSRVCGNNLFTVAIKTDGTLWAWGGNAYGQLGQGDTLARSSPIQVGTSTNWSKMSDSFSNLANIAGIKTDGTLWLWGRNSYGDLGLNDRVHRSSPVQLGTATNWTSVSPGNRMFSGVRSGNLFTWGSNASGQLGSNVPTNTYRSSPVQVGSDSTWSIGVSGKNTFHLLYYKTNGTLWSWGTNNQGQLGLNSIIYRSSPTQIGTSTNWTNLIASSEYVKAAIKTDGTLWTWGPNSRGETGQNASSSTSISSPTQVGANTKWNNVSASSYAIYGTQDVA